MKTAGRQALGTDAARLSPVAAWRPVPWWGVLSAAAALVFLVAGCTVAPTLQPSSLACEMATALALRPAVMPGRPILAVSLDAWACEAPVTNSSPMRCVWGATHMWTHRMAGATRMRSDRAAPHRNA